MPVGTQCERCARAHATIIFGGIALCDECYEAAGSCCAGPEDG